MKWIIDFATWFACCSVLYYFLEKPLGDDAVWSTVAIMLCTTFYAKVERKLERILP